MIFLSMVFQISFPFDVARKPKHYTFFLRSRERLFYALPKERNKTSIRMVFIPISLQNPHIFMEFEGKRYEKRKLENFFLSLDSGTWLK